MKLILTREVAGLGLAGDIVEVADGYGRNFLVPRGAAIGWSKGAEKQIAQIRRARDAREIRDLGHAREIKTDLEKLSVSLGARAGKDGRLFGSITAADIANAVKDAGGPNPGPQADPDRRSHQDDRSAYRHDRSAPRRRRVRAGQRRGALARSDTCSTPARPRHVRGRAESFAAMSGSGRCVTGSALSSGVRVAKIRREFVCPQASPSRTARGS